VFGRVTGVAATKYILGGDVKKVDLKELTKGGLTGEVTASKLAGGSYEDNMNKPKAAAKANKPPAGHVEVAVVQEMPQKCDCLKGRTYDQNVGLAMKSCLVGAACVCWYTIHYYVATGGL